MREFSRHDIVDHRFTSGRKKGYDTLEVDGFLVLLADYIGSMQGELARHQASERTALDVLQQAQRVADETLATAQRDAEGLQRNAALGLENAREDARSMLDDARAEADRTLLAARAQSESAVEHSRAQIAELESAGAARMEVANRLVEELRQSAADCALDFRSAGSRLFEMADHFEFEFPIPDVGIDAPSDDGIDVHDDGIDVHDDGIGVPSGDGIDVHDDVSIEFAEERVEVN